MRIGRVLVITLGGIVLGLAWNALSGRGLALTKNVYIQDEDEVIETAEAKRRLDLGALFLDARPRPFFDMSRIPGAAALPEDDFEAAFAGLEEELRSRFDLVIYCSGWGCEASHIVARKLRERGIHAAILHEGLPAWEDAGYALEQGTSP